MEWLFLGLFVVFIAGAGLFLGRISRAKKQRVLADARADALRWYERLGGQVMNLHGDQPAVRQALADASERYNAAGSQLESARTERQYELARETALEGLHYARAARTALGLEPGPELPLLAGQRAAGAITKEREVELQGHVYKASPHPGGGTPHYYPGGRIHGRPVPAGWYSEPWWKTALVAGAWGIGSLLIFDALFSPAWGDAGYDAGFHDGAEYADTQDGGDYGDSGGDYGAGGGDYGAGDFGGGDFGGGDFG